MPSGAAVIEYQGKRGRVFRVKYADADGRQIMETLGPEREGWTRRKAEAELRERLVRVQRKGYRRPGPLSFGDYAETWFAEGETRRRWKASTAAQYASIRRWLVGHFGPMPLAAIRPRHVAEYIAEASREKGRSASATRRRRRGSALSRFPLCCRRGSSLTTSEPRISGRGSGCSATRSAAPSTARRRSRTP